MQFILLYVLLHAQMMRDILYKKDTDETGKERYGWRFL